MSTEDVGTFYFDVIKTLEELECRYVIIGAFAAAAYGGQRTTKDVDIVVALSEDDVQALAERYADDRYYADPQQMRDAIKDGTMFNLIDSIEGQWVDIVPITMNPLYRRALTHRVRRPYLDPGGKRLEAWFARPEDVIFGKLMAWCESHASRHEQDIYEMLFFIYSSLDQDLTDSFDESNVDQAITQLCADAGPLWDTLKTMAREDASAAD